MTGPKSIAAVLCMLAATATAVTAAEPTDADRAVRTEQPADSTRTDAEQQNRGAADRAASRSADAPAARAGARADRLDLDTTVVTGNRELPKVLYIVPWKKADIGDLPGQPFNTLLDEALTPVDRDVFRREVTYYGAISGDSNSVEMPASGQPQATGGSEK